MASNLPTLPAAPVAELATPIGETAARLMSGTRVAIMGRLVADPKLRYTGAGVAWARMSLALRGTDGIILQRVLASGRLAEASAKIPPHRQPRSRGREAAGATVDRRRRRRSLRRGHPAVAVDEACSRGICDPGQGSGAWSPNVHLIAVILDAYSPVVLRTVRDGPASTQRGSVCG